MSFLKKQMYVMHLSIPTIERKKYIKTFKNQKSLGDDFKPITDWSQPCQTS